MKHTFRKKAAGLLAVLTLCSGLTGCSMFNKTAEIYDQASDIIDQAAEQVLGSDEKSGTETTAASAENETETTTTKSKGSAMSSDEDEKDKKSGKKTESSSGSGIAAATQEDVDAARETLERFLNACTTGDSDTILDISNADSLFSLLGEDMDPEAIRQQLTESLGSISNFEISEGEFDAEMVENFNSYLQEMQEVMGDSSVMGDLDFLPSDLFSSIYHPIDGVCAFDVTATVDGETETETMYLVRSGGEWTLDMALIPAMIGYVSASKTASANSKAKSLQIAVNCALTDMDAEGMDIGQLNGTLTFQADDFRSTEHVVNAGTKEDLLKELKYKISIYFSDVQSIPAFACTVENGICTAAAVQNTDAAGNAVYGTYPHTSGEEDVYPSLEDALAAANP